MLYKSANFASKRRGENNLEIQKLRKKELSYRKRYILLAPLEIVSILTMG